MGSPGDVYRVSIIGAAYGAQIVNTFHVRQVSGLIGTVQGDIQSVWNTSCKTTYLALLAAGYSHQRLNVIKVSAGAPEGGDEALTGPGTAVGDPLPIQAAGVLSCRTGIPGRRYRGRMYLGPFTENDQASSTLTGTKLTAINAFATAMFGAFSSTDQFEWVIWSEVGGFSTPVTNVIAQPIMGIIRRRRPGQGA